MKHLLLAIRKFELGTASDAETALVADHFNLNILKDWFCKRQGEWSKARADQWVMLKGNTAATRTSHPVDISEMSEKDVQSRIKLIEKHHANHGKEQGSNKVLTYPGGKRVTVSSLTKDALVKVLTLIRKFHCGEELKESGQEFLELNFNLEKLMKWTRTRHHQDIWHTASVDDWCVPNGISAGPGKGQLLDVVPIQDMTQESLAKSISYLLERYYATTTPSRVTADASWLAKGEVLDSKLVAQEPTAVSESTEVEKLREEVAEMRAESVEMYRKILEQLTEIKQAIKGE